MSVIILLLGVSLVIGVGFLIAFIKNFKEGQFDDCYSPSHRILFKDHSVENKNKEEK